MTSAELQVRLGVSFCEAVVHTSACEENWEAGAVGAELSCADASGLSAPPCRALHTCSGHGTTCIEDGFTTTECKELQILTQCVGPFALAALCSMLKSLMAAPASRKQQSLQNASPVTARDASAVQSTCALPSWAEVCRSSGAH